MRARSFVLLLLSVAVGPAALVACGGGSGSGSGSGSGTTSAQVTSGETEGFDMEGFEEGEPTVDHGSQSARATIGINAPPTPFDEMSREDQEYWMAGQVLPIANEMFHEYDAARYNNVTCALCHGDDGMARGYEMPSQYLPRLPQPGTAAWTAARERNPRAWEFMETQVLPTVATQIGEPPNAASTGEGFGCFECHMQLQ